MSCCRRLSILSSDMLKLSKPIIFLLTLFLFCGCSQNFDEKHSHFDLGISIYLPEDWTRINLDPNAALTSMAFENGKNATVLMRLNPEDNLASQIKRETQANFPILESGPLLFTKYKTSWMLHADNDRTSITYVLKDREGQIFTIVGSSENLYFTSFRPIFDKMVRSFRSY